MQIMATLQCMVPFVKVVWLELELPAANPKVSNSVFSISSYILVLRYEVPREKIEFLKQVALLTQVLQC